MPELSGKPTPAPWQVEDGGFVGGPVGFGRICQTWNKHEEDFQNAEANARLIAAAPDLLEACKRGRQKLVTYTAIYSGDKELRTLLDLWDAAIAKAEGREVAHAS